MLSEEIFDFGINLMQRHFNRELLPEVQAIWREFLDQELTDEDFDIAVKEAILSCQFFPTAKQLVEFAQLGNEIKAMREWQMLVVPAAITGSADGRKELLDQLSVRGRIALELIGTISTVEMTEEKWLHNLGKKFKEVYCKASLGDNLLPVVKPKPKEYVAQEVADMKVEGIIKNPQIQSILERAKRHSQGDFSLEETYRRCLNINGWQIDDDRFQYFLEQVEDKNYFIEQMNFHVLKKGKYPSLVFDNLSNYQPRNLNYNPKEIASQWLAQVESDEFVNSSQH